MSFTYGICKLPKNNDLLLSKISDACSRLETKLNHINFSELDITDYNKKYINQMIGTPAGLRNTTRKYAFVLAWALHKVEDISKITFLDYGAGHGLLSMLAAELGLGKSVMSDIFGPSMDDAKVLSEKLNLKIDHFIVGDIEETINYIKDHNLNVDVVSNYDTIEHIYNIDNFLNNLNKFGTNITYFFASGANGDNPFIKKLLVKDHLLVEFKDKKIVKGHKASDSSLAYIKLRRKYITEVFKDFSDDELDELVRVTRGKRKDDILKIAEEYKSTNTLPAEIPEPTDTCDPANGNWAEHIMNPFELNKKLEKFNFENTFVIAGYYGKPKKLIKKMAGFIFNIYTRIMPVKQGLILAPFYAIYGRKR